MIYKLRSFFIQNFLWLVLVGLILTIQGAFGWTNPSQNPPGGNGVITTLSNGNVGIGISNPTQKLSVGGVIQSTTGGFRFPDGSTQLSAASAPAWSSITGKPAGFADDVDNGLTSVDWSIITGKPAGFADNIDDTAGSVSWSNVTGKPGGFADDVDNTASFSVVYDNTFPASGSQTYTINLNTYTYPFNDTRVLLPIVTLSNTSGGNALITGFGASCCGGGGQYPRLTLVTQSLSANTNVRIQLIRLQ